MTSRKKYSAPARGAVPQILYYEYEGSPITYKIS
jgi:hypothetical protein